MILYVDLMRKQVLPEAEDYSYLCKYPPDPDEDPYVEPVYDSYDTFTGPATDGVVDIPETGGWSVLDLTLEISIQKLV
jgi:hypothetical protein